MFLKALNVSTAESLQIKFPDVQIMFVNFVCFLCVF